MPRSWITAVLTAVTMLAASCMKMDMMNSDPSFDELEGRIAGYVTDTDDNPIEHIKVTLDWNGGAYQEIKYSDSNGLFVTDIWIPETPEVVTLAITIEDIDGEENGGLFEPLSDAITLFENESQTPSEPMVFRLNRATASECSPQS